MNEHVAPLPKPQKNNFLRFLLIFVLVVLLIPIVAGAFFEEQISNKLLKELNKSLKTELKTRETELSFLRDFPKAAVVLKGVTLKGTFGGNLLEAEKVSFRFGIFSLFSDQIQIKTIRVQNGALRLLTDKAGKTNDNILKETSTPNSQNTAQKDLAIAIQDAEFSDMELIYDNKQTAQTVHLEVQNALFSGDLAAKKFKMASRADYTIHAIDMRGTRYLAGEKMHYDATLAVDMDKGIYNLQGMELTVGDNTFAAEGTITNQPTYQDFNLKLNSKEGDISMVFNLLPAEYHTYFNDFKSSGVYACGGTVRGRLSAKERPEVTFTVNLRQGEITSDKLQSPIKNVELKAVFTDKPDGSSRFEIEGFRGNFGGQKFTFDLLINNLDDPMVRFSTNGTLPLAAVYGLLNMPEISSAEGLVQVKSLQFSGRYADMTSMTGIGNILASGDLVFDNAEIVYNRVPIILQNGSFHINDNLWLADNIAAKIGNSDFVLTGNARNMLPVLFADSLNTADALLEFDTDMKCQNLDVDELLQMFSVQETASQAGGEAKLDSLKTAKNAERKSTTEKLKGVFRAEIDQFNFEKITGSEFAGNFTFDQNKLQIAGGLNTMQGKIQMQGEHHFEKKPWIKLRFLLENLDLTTCFEQCENFGQEVILSENISGRLSGKVVVSAFWDEKTEFLTNKTICLADIKATNGEMKKVKMLEDFSAFIHIDDLRRIKFTELQNYFDLHDGKMFFPAMFIQNNACNMTISGTHTLNNDIDYKIKVNAGQTLLNRIKKHDKDLDALPEKNGLFNLFYTIDGNLGKYNMRRDKRGVKDAFEKSEAKKIFIERALNAEF